MCHMLLWVHAHFTLNKTFDLAVTKAKQPLQHISDRKDQRDVFPGKVKRAMVMED